MSFRPVRDDDDTFDAFGTGSAKADRGDDPRGPADRGESGSGAEEAGSSGERPKPGARPRSGARPGPGAGPGSETAAEERPAAEPVNFFAPKKPVAGPSRSAPGAPPKSADHPGPEAPEPAEDRPAPSALSGAALFAKPAALGGPATTDEPVPDEEEPSTESAQDESQRSPSDEPSTSSSEEPDQEDDPSVEPDDALASGPEQPQAAELDQDAEALEDGETAESSSPSPSPDETSAETAAEAASEAAAEAQAEEAQPEGPEAEEAQTEEPEAEPARAEEAQAAGPEAEEPEAEEPEAAAVPADDASSQDDALSRIDDSGEERGAADQDDTAGDEWPMETTPGRGTTSMTRTEPLPAKAAEALMTALGDLRESVADLRFGLDLPGAEEARQAQAELLAQLEDYVLPRVKTSTAPALIVIAGSTGAGKSTLVNSLAERNVSRTGVRRPTTGTPVLVCHPEDRSWFAEGELLGNLTRLDKPTPEADMNGIIVVATEKLPQGVALLDTPDIDSVVEEHHEVAHRMLDAADLWIFVTTAARYADAPAWKLLKLAKERAARLAIVLSRVQPKSADVVLKHFVRMLTEYGLGEIDRFVINESKVSDGRLPDSEVTDLRLWLAELSVDEERRAQAVRETLNGVLDSFRTRVPALAKHLEAQAAFRSELHSDVEASFLSALSVIDKASKNGSLLHGEVLARWQDYAGSGDLMRSLRLGRRGRAARQAPERVTAFKAAIRTGLESVIVAAANRAAEEVVARWRHRSELGAKLGEGLERPSDNLVRHTGRAIASWQDHLGELVRTEGVAKRSVSKLVSFDPDSLSLIFMVAMFSGGNGEGVPHRLVNALLGAESLRGIGAKALSDLRARIGMLFDEEAMRYVQALDSAGIPDESVATRLYQATYNLEVAR